jgi:Fe-S-cluster containining protein
MPSLKLKALGVPRSRCDGCGSSCSSFRVGPLLAEDKLAVQAVLPAVKAAFPDQLDRSPFAEEPWKGQTQLFLAKKDGFCVFHRAGTGCTIHATAGLEAKPLVCQLYPLQVIEAEDGLRRGTRSTCLADHAVWADGPPTDGAFLERILADPNVAMKREKPPAEDVAMHVANLPDLDTNTVLCFLAERPDRSDPPAIDGWLAERLTALLLEARDVLDTFPADHQGPLHPKATIGRHFADFRRWAATSPATFPELGEADRPYFRDALRRFLFLRETSLFPTVPWALICAVTAARWGAAWATAQGKPFGRCFSVLLVAMESPRLQRAILEDGPPFA